MPFLHGAPLRYVSQRHDDIDAAAAMATRQRCQRGEDADD